MPQSTRGELRHARTSADRDTSSTPGSTLSTTPSSTPGRTPSRTTKRLLGLAVVAATVAGVAATTPAMFAGTSAKAAPPAVQAALTAPVDADAELRDGIVAQAGAQKQKAAEEAKAKAKAKAQADAKAAKAKADKEAARKAAAKKAAAKKAEQQRASRSEGRRQLKTAPAAAAAPSGWTTPVASVSFSAQYGQAGGWSSGYHTGVDFVVPTGTAIRAVGPGTVVSASFDGAYGNNVVIRHSDGRYTQYAHLSSLGVSAGQSVSGGQRIGLSGATGNVTGPHLHFEARSTPGYGSDSNPLAYLRSHGVRV